jgi:predicted ABC-type ATPase
MPPFLPFAVRHVAVKIKARILSEEPILLHFTFATRHSSRRMKQCEHTGISIIHNLGHALVDELNVTSGRVNSKN